MFWIGFSWGWRDWNWKGSRADFFHPGTISPEKILSSSATTTIVGLVGGENDLGIKSSNGLSLITSHQIDRSSSTRKPPVSRKTGICRSVSSNWRPNASTSVGGMRWKDQKLQDLDVTWHILAPWFIIWFHVDWFYHGLTHICMYLPIWWVLKKWMTLLWYDCWSNSEYIYIYYFIFDI